MEATAPIIKLDPEKEIGILNPDIYQGMLAAATLIKKHTNGHLVNISIDTEDVLKGFWNKYTVKQKVTFKVEITIDLREEQK
jgi:hypothetical protein